MARKVLLETGYTFNPTTAIVSATGTVGSIDILQICTAKLAATCNAAMHACGAALRNALCVEH